MHFIIYDIEATCWDPRPANKAQEIIEIGAYKLNRYGEVLDVFNKFVRPVVHPTLSIFCKHLTSISQVDVNRSPRFPEVIEAFQDWIDIWDEEYLLCSWGIFDKKILIQDCDLHNMDAEWVKPHLNVKKQYHDIKGLRKTRGLRYCVEKEGFEFTGMQHRGISDAENLAKLFGKYIDMWQY